MITYLDADIRPLEQGWTMLICEPGTFEGPDSINRALARLSAPVPGTVAEALSKAGLFDPAHPAPLHNKEAWYFRPLQGEAPGPAILRFEGLATMADVYLNGALVLASASMFEAHDVPIVLTGEDELAICFRALTPHLDKRGPRARWRPQMMSHQGLRLVRTTALGYMPGWCPDIHALGPYRPISLIRTGRHALEDLRIHADLDDDGTGLLQVSFALNETVEIATLSCAGHTTALIAQPNGRYHATLTLPAITPWWPATHGTPHLHGVMVELDGKRYSLGLTGFRRIRIDHGLDGKDFAVTVNGVKIFCRGAVWTNADITRLPGSGEDYAPWLSLAAQTGMNMIRIGGTMTYESADFFRLCDQLGLMVWQDFIFANFDYPITDDSFVAHVQREAEHVLGATQGSPSMAILCGGSEIFQQGAMLGLKEESWKSPLFTQHLAKISATLRPDVPYIDNTPMGGAMPFAPNEAIAHYYGVGAYQRPLDDARRANLRFAAESLAFAQVPQQTTLDRHLPVPPVHDPRWKARVPRDRGASWDFEDTRDFYLGLLYGVDPARLRREHPARYLHLSRAVTGEVLEETYSEWRRPGSSCHGALVWTFQDLLPGPGWGMVDSTLEPKPVWYAARRAFSHVRVSMTDEGTNGLDVHLAHDGPQSRHLTLHLRCLRDGKTTVVSATRAITLEPRASMTLPATSVLGAFFDITYAFRFGPAAHSVTVATLNDADTGEMISQAFHFPGGRSAALYDANITVTLTEEARGWFLTLDTDQLAQSVHIDLDNGRPEDDFFHLAPGHARRIHLLNQGQKPQGEILTAGSDRRFRF
ncbi:beta-mannosidase [Agrobacterium vitis]|nr:beta-mannosidase [Agrobacterium vitis]MBE1439641.1 beta-mannosidase [Agrobacterium vitis]